MSMNGIDVSAFQAGMNLSKVKADFIIIRATKGAAKDGSFDDFIGQIKKMDKPYGIYHIAYPQYNGAAVEAEAYIKVAKPYFGKMIPILDWETPGVNNVAWAEEWLRRVEKAAGVKPMIYMSQYVENAYDWSRVAAAGYPLWIAKYRDYGVDYDYNMTMAGSRPVLRHWKAWAMWQWTSVGRLTGYTGNLDCNLFSGNKSHWETLAGIKEPPNTIKKTKTLTASAISAYARQVIAGKFGNGDARVKALKAQLKKDGYAGTDANVKKIQTKVNGILTPKPKVLTASAITAYAKRVIRGEFGNGAERVKAIKATIKKDGYAGTAAEADKIQAKVNALLK